VCRAAVLVLALAAAPAACAAGLEAINPESYYPEGPLWFAGRLWYAEMSRDRVMAWGPGGNRAVWQQEGCGPTSLAPAPGGGLFVLCHLGHRIVRIGTAGETLAEIGRDAAGGRLSSPNDSVADVAGGVYVSSSGRFDPAAPATGAVLYIAPEGGVRRVAEGLRYANGLAITPDGAALLVSEHLARRVLRFPIGPGGALAPPRVFVGLDALAPPPADPDPYAGPDGLAVDRDGNVYIAEYGAGRVLIVDAAGALLETLVLPERYVTNLAFGADEGTLFVTAPGSNSVRPYIGRVYRLANPLRRGR